MIKHSVGPFIEFLEGRLFSERNAVEALAALSTAIEIHSGIPSHMETRGVLLSGTRSKGSCAGVSPFKKQTPPRAPAGVVFLKSPPTPAPVSDSYSVTRRL